MKKLSLLILLATFTVSAHANEFIEKESSRSGVKGTFQMIGNSLNGFFSNLGGLAKAATGQQ